jgi:biotin operon repressor
LGLRSEQAGIGTKEQFRYEGSQLHLADALGLTPVHVNRTLQALRNAGEIIFVGHNVRIHDWHRFAELADFDPQYLRFGAEPVESRNARDASIAAQ